MNRTVNNLIKKKIYAVFFLLILFIAHIPATSLDTGIINTEFRRVSFKIPAVYESENRQHGISSTMTVTMTNGTGYIFLHTFPLSQVDMQGSARMAVSVAGSITGVDVKKYDFFFVVSTESSIIGGPSAGASMCVAVISLLMNWRIEGDVMMTGTINPDGSIGPVGGIVQKSEAAASAGMDFFLIPHGQDHYQKLELIGNEPVMVDKYVSHDAMSLYNLDVREVKTVNDALIYFTGRTFQSADNTQAGPSLQYISIMSMMSSEMMERTSEIIGNINYNNLSLSERAVYNRANETFTKGIESYLSGEYYSSSSYSFRAAVDFRYILWRKEYALSGYSRDYIDGRYNLVRNGVLDALKWNENLNIEYSSDLQLIGAVESRIREAQRNLDESKALINGALYDDALSKLAFTFERTGSALWWRNIYNMTDRSGDLIGITVSSFASDYIASALTTISYGNSIISSSNNAATLLFNAERIMIDAQDDFRKGYYASALMNAVDATTNVNAAILIASGQPVSDAIESASNRSAEAIGISRAEGIEPYLSISLREYAKTLESENLISSLRYYDYSYQTSVISRFISNMTKSSSESIYVGIPKPRKSSAVLNLAFYSALIGATVGISGGFAIGYLYMYENHVRVEKNENVKKARIEEDE